MGIVLPKGGGAIRGISEKFSVNAANGTGSLSLSIPVTPGRSDFSPSLMLAYDSGSGNGVFGFGWSLAVPEIGRKTDKGLPRYDDAAGSDVFLLSGAEDLVPVFATAADGTLVLEDGAPVIRDDPRTVVTPAGPVAFTVRRYRPRIDTTFARIERWTRADGDVHWRSYSADNLMSLYGRDAGSRIADPADPSRVFRWLLCETRDDRGNAILYDYRAEDAAGLDLAAPHEASRGAADDPRRRVNRHLKRIRYGNRKPLLAGGGTRPPFLAAADAAAAEWMFEVVFDYGDHHPEDPAPHDDSARDADGALLYPWPVRGDPFSTCRAGFEIRTLRLCRRVLMFHHMPGDAEMGRPTLVRAMDFAYDAATSEGGEGPGYACLSSAVLMGYRAAAGGRVARSLPAISFGYSRMVLGSRIEALASPDLDSLPSGLPGLTPEAPGAWVDLYGEGLASILSEEGGGWIYRRNLSPLPVDGTGPDPPPARFAPAVAVAEMPRASLTTGAAFLDLAGDGLPDLAVLAPPVPGFWEQDGREGWDPFRPFAQPLRHDLADPGLRFVDLTGDGLADVLVSDEDAFRWHPSLGEAGFGPALRVALAPGDDGPPRRLASGGAESLHLADMSGDGLSDIVRIRNGEVSYWPNLGHGRFGARIVMSDAPRLDDPDQFDPARVHLADIDGSGTTDLIYLHREGVRLVFNRSGNGWSAPVPLPLVPPAADPARVAVLDLLGNGTACLVWSSPLPGDRGRQIRYVSLMAAGKPHLLTSLDNGLGAETRIGYAPSTRFYLEDRQAGRPWRHRLPFPVHVVERVEQIDHVGRTLFVSLYAYHDGYFDGEEREFRGFGVVDQRDTGTLAALGDGAPVVGPGPAANLDPASHLAPVLIRTWFHTGGADPADIAGTGRPGAFREPGATPAEAAAMILAAPPLPPGLSAQETREAARALKGAMLRQEVYAEDAGPDAPPEARARARTPYRVTEQSTGVRLLQPRGGNRHAVFAIHAAEALDWIYERDPADPRCSHRLVLETDEHGNALKEAQAGYARRAAVRTFRDGGWRMVPNPALAGLDPRNRARQTTPLVTYVETRVTRPVAQPHAWLAPRPCEAVGFELTGYGATGPGGRYRPGDLVEPDPARPGRLRLRPGAEVPYEAAPPAGPCRRVIDWQRSFFRTDDLSGLLPLGQTGRRALPGQRLRLAFTPGLVAAVFRRPAGGGGTEALMPDPGAVLGGQGDDQGGYVAGETLAAEGLVPAGEPPGQWWRPLARTFYAADPDATPAAELAEALAHFFLPRRFTDPFGKDQTVAYDAHDLLPVEMTDAAGNRTVAEANDYRVLAPRRIRDPNGNVAEVAFDALGRVAGTALMGKADPAAPEGDTLAGFEPDPDTADLAALIDAPSPEAAATALVAGATSRLAYDLDRFARTRAAHPDDPAAWQPAAAAFLEREEHLAAAGSGARIRIAVAHSDGMGRDIQTKSSAAPGPVVPGGPDVARWRASGWTIFDNKGNPVRRYEPFFSATQAFEFGVRIGVSPVLFYDPAGRAVATLYPNGTYDKTVFDAWSETRFDVNDTSAAHGDETGTPLTDRHIAGHVAAHLGALAAGGTPWRPWAAARGGGALGPHEAAAAARAAAHADTPATDHLDVLGRTFLTVTRNRTVCPGHPRDGTEETLLSRTDLDIEGNAVEIRDPLASPAAPHGRLVLRTTFDLVGRMLRSESLDAGTAWQIPDALDAPIRLWDARGHGFVIRHDALRRPVAQEVRGTGPEADPRTLGRTLVVERTDYGELAPQAQALNLRGRIWRRFDGAGVETNARLNAQGDPVEAYDFKGNLLASTRQIAADYKALPDWSGAVALLPGRLETRTRYDALNRPVLSVPGRVAGAGVPFHLIQPDYDEGGQVRRIDVWLDRPDMPAARIDPGADPPSAAGVASLRHDAHGRRERVILANGAVTDYGYDPLTFRLVRLVTRRPAAGFPADDPAVPDPAWPGRLLQNLTYTYDPAGNVTHVRDTAQQAIFFGNRRVEPDGDFVHDALYRLVEARGREHLGQAAAAPYSSDDAHRLRLPHPGDGAALSPYVERYLLDPVNGLAELTHRSLGPAPVGWTRRFAADAPGRIEGRGAETGNALTRTDLSGDGVAPVAEALLHDPLGQVIRLPHLGGAPGARNLSWTPGRRLGEADLGGGGRAFYAYDAEGARVRKVWEKSPGLIEERLYFGHAEIFRRHAGPIGAAPPVLERETLHVTDDRRRVAIVETRRHDSAGTDPAPAQLIRHQLGDRLGNVSLELEGAARLLSHEEYSPYGSTTYQAVRSQTDLPRRYRYAGKERDEETGLIDYGARLYAPWLGRWISPDPSGIADGPDPYVYARANPVTLTDPDGSLAGAGDADPNSVLAAALALQQAARIISASAAAAKVAATTTGVVAADAAVATTAAQTMGTAAPAAGATASSLATTAAAALVAAQVIAAVAMALAVDLHMKRSANIVMYGNPWGVPKTDTAFPVLRVQREMKQTEPFPVPEPLPAPDPAPKDKPKKDEKQKPRWGRVYVTYTKYNKRTGLTYTGRTSAVIDLNKPWEPQADAAVAARDANHHIDEDDEPEDPDFSIAVRDKFAVGYAVDYKQRYRDVGYLAIRGREQQMIDYHGKKKADELKLKTFKGGAKSDSGKPYLTENNVRGVAKDNLARHIFHNAADLAFGNKAAFTGNP